MEKTKEVFYKAKWRDLHIKKIGGRDVPKDSKRRRTVYYIMYKGAKRILSDIIVDSLEIRYT